MENVEVFGLLHTVINDPAQGVQPKPLFELIKQFAQNVSDCITYYLIALYNARNPQKKDLNESMFEMDEKDVTQAIKCKWAAVDALYNADQTDVLLSEFENYSRQSEYKSPDYKSLDYWSMLVPTFRTLRAISRQKYGMGVLNLSNAAHQKLYNYISFTVWRRATNAYTYYKTREDRPKFFGAIEWESIAISSDGLSSFIVDIYNTSEALYNLSSINRMSEDATKLWNIVIITLIVAYGGQWERANYDDPNKTYWTWLNKSGWLVFTNHWKDLDRKIDYDAKIRDIGMVNHKEVTRMMDKLLEKLSTGLAPIKPKFLEHFVTFLVSLIQRTIYEMKFDTMGDDGEDVITVEELQTAIIKSPTLHILTQGPSSIQTLFEEE